MPRSRKALSKVLLALVVVCLIAREAGWISFHFLTTSFMTNCGSISSARVSGQEDIVGSIYNEQLSTSAASPEHAVLADSLTASAQHEIQSSLAWANASVAGLTIQRIEKSGVGWMPLFKWSEVRATVLARVDGNTSSNSLPQYCTADVDVTFYALGSCTHDHFDSEVGRVLGRQFGASVAKSVTRDGR